MQRDVARKKHDAHAAAPNFADHLEVLAKMSFDLFALPCGRRVERHAQHGQLECVSVAIDWERESTHDQETEITGVVAVRAFFDTAFASMVCLKEELCRARLVRISLARSYLQRANV